jgi:hypothetical protein
MPIAPHLPTLLALDFPGGANETKYDYPVKLRIPTKLASRIRNSSWRLSSSTTIQADIVRILDTIASADRDRNPRKRRVGLSTR